MADSRPTGNILQDPERALAEVVGFVMILAMIVLFLSIWVTYAVPAQGRAAEIEHSNYIKDWFTDYKFSLDSLWNNNQGDTRSGILVSTSLDLGTLGGNTEVSGLFIAIMKPIGSYGALMVSNYNETVTIAPFGGNSTTFNLSTLEYTAGNYYWLPQTYYYQMGGVFLNQTSGTVALIRPSIKINSSMSPVALEVTPINLTPAAGTSQISGSASTRIDSRLMSKISYPLDGTYPSVGLVFRLRDTATARAWKNILEEEVCKGQCSISINQQTVVMNLNQTVNLTVVPANYIVAVQPIGSIQT
jgi:hypothetical protein